MVADKVDAMMNSIDAMVPTAPLDEFITAYEQDDNLWWSIACGHHQNLFDAAIGEIDHLRQVLRLLRLNLDDALGLYSMDMQRPPYELTDLEQLLDKAGFGYGDGEVERSNKGQQ